MIQRPNAVIQANIDNDRLLIVRATEPGDWDARSDYVERYWVRFVGPTGTFLLRRMAAQLDASPRGFVLNVTDTASGIGVGHEPMINALGRLLMFNLVRVSDYNELSVRTSVPTLPASLVARMPLTQQEQHRFLVARAVAS